VLHIKPVC